MACLSHAVPAKSLEYFTHKQVLTRI